MSRIFVTGGAGYVGSHTCKRLATLGHEVAVYDNLSRGHPDFVKWGQLIEGDLNERKKLRDSMKQFAPDAVMHFAAYAYVGESVDYPELYYENNVGGTLSLLSAMQAAEVGLMILSSSCTVYGEPERTPIKEEVVQRPLSPYGVSKMVSEQMCHDFEQAYGIRYVALRYFNACGADPGGEIGERHDPETHLIPRALMAAEGEIDSIEVYGDDYETPDGTCVRDFIHVTDLANAHIAAASYLVKGGASGAFNIGTGQGKSVREVIKMVERITNKPVPQRNIARRVGDSAKLISDVSKAKRLLDWSPQFSDLDTIVRTAWEWQRKGPTASPRN
jgi:UDP-arabinose 4-epimerase